MPMKLNHKQWNPEDSLAFQNSGKPRSYPIIYTSQWIWRDEYNLLTQELETLLRKIKKKKDMSA